MDNRLCLGALLAKGVNVCHNVVAHLFFPFGGSFVIHIVLVCFHLGYLLVGYIKTASLFCLCKRYPQLSPGTEFVVIGKNILHLVAGIAGGKGRYIFIVITHC